MTMLDAAYQGSRTVDLADCTVCYVRKGKGAPLLLVHGVPLSLLTWRNVIDELARHFTVVAVDLKGFGRSQKPDGDYSAEGQARTLVALVEALGLGAVTLVGSSYGCAPAIYAALARRDLIAQLVLINSVGGLGRRHGVERLLRIAGVTPAVRAVLRRSGLMKRIFTARLRQCYADPSQASSDLVNAYLELLGADDGEASFLATLRDFDEHRLATRLADITQPVLVVWGEQDRVLPIGVGRRLSQRIRRAQFAVLTGCAHFPQEEAPHRFAALVERFAGMQAGTLAHDAVR
jgi:pimeloyl-ACP methyl ester carboxylesterase